MKKIILGVATVIGASGAFAQVSTVVEKKTAVLEEFTGNYCTYCPAGHKIEDQIDANASLKAITIKIQTGDFSGTDPIFGGTLETPDGEAVATAFATASYPNGSVSRRAAYKGLARGSWLNAVQTINTEDAPVNLYMQSAVDVTTRQITGSVEYYYTGTQPDATNKLVIGYYQDNIPAFQYDPGFYPSQFYILSEEIYQFDHAFRGMINGVTGAVIPTSSASSTATVPFTFNLPASFSTFDVEAGSVKLFAYVIASASGEILNATKISPVYNNFPNTDEVGIVYSSGITSENCVGQADNFTPTVLVGNYGGNNLTAFATDYNVGAATGTDSWSGNISHNQKVAVPLAALNFTYAATNSYSIDVSAPNGNVDPTIADNSFSGSFNAGPSYT